MELVAHLWLAEGWSETPSWWSSERVGDCGRNLVPVRAHSTAPAARRTAGPGTRASSCARPGSRSARGPPRGTSWAGARRTTPCTPTAAPRTPRARRPPTPGHLSAPAGLRGPSRHDRPGREPEGPRDLAGRLAEAEQPQRLGPGLLGVAGVLGAPAGPGDPRRLDRQAPAEGLLLPGRERPAGRRAPQPARGGRGQPLRPHPLHAEHLILVCIQCSLRSDRSNRSNFLPQFRCATLFCSMEPFTTAWNTL